MRKPKSKLADLVWGQLNQNDTGALQGYLNRFPKSPHARDAARAIDDILWTRLDENQQPDSARFPGQESKQRASWGGPIDPGQNGFTSGQKAGIQSALDKFNGAFQHQQRRELKDVWPNAPNDLLEALGQPGGAKTVIILQPIGEPKISGDTAVVPCNSNSKTTMPGGQTTPHQKQVNVHLHKAGSGWIISSVGQ